MQNEKQSKRNYQQQYYFGNLIPFKRCRCCNAHPCKSLGCLPQSNEKNKNRKRVIGSVLRQEERYIQKYSGIDQCGNQRKENIIPPTEIKIKDSFNHTIL